MIKSAALVFGLAFLAVGILGFVPAVTKDGMLLGIFHVNTAHNLVHLASGAAALLAGLTSSGAARVYFRVFGVIYALVAVLGLIQGDTPLLGLIANNMADVWLHFGIATLALILGFVGRDTPAL